MESSEFVLTIFYPQLINSGHADSVMADKNHATLSSWRWTRCERTSRNTKKSWRHTRKNAFTCDQEPITGSPQLPHIPVTAFSQTDLFLVWIYLEFRSHRNLSDQEAESPQTMPHNNDFDFLYYWDDFNIFYFLGFRLNARPHKRQRFKYHRVEIKVVVLYCKYGLMLTCWHVHERPHCFIVTEAC